MLEQLDAMWAIPLVRVITALMLAFAVTAFALAVNLFEARADRAYLLSLLNRRTPANDEE